MRIYHNIEEFEKVQNAVVTTGTFDGVHVCDWLLIGVNTASFREALPLSPARFAEQAAARCRDVRENLEERWLKDLT